MVNNANILNKIILLSDFSTIDNIMFHYYSTLNLIILILLFINILLLFYMAVNKMDNKRLERVFQFSFIITGLLGILLLINNDPISIGKQTDLNEEQIALLKTIEDPKVIQAINYNVAQYGKNLYAINKSLFETEATLEEIEKEKQQLQQFINPPKFL